MMSPGKRCFLLFCFIQAIAFAACSQKTDKVISCDDPGICGPHGVCDDNSGTARCVCNQGYTGRYCDECDTGYMSDGAGNCVQGTDCDSYCAAQGRVCASEGGADMTCGDCLPGWFEENGHCIQACEAAHYPGELVQLDVYILLDRSFSMLDDDKWAKTTAAIDQFVSSPDASGIGVGLQFLPVEPPPETTFVENCTNDDDCGLYGSCDWGYCLGYWAQDSSCDPADYVEPVVDIAPLPGAASAISQAMADTSATGSQTPIQPAMEGVYQYLADYAAANPTHLVYLLLAADGMPMGCTFNTTAASADAAEEMTSNDPPVYTYVFGVEDAQNNLEGLNAIAAKGGTGSAILVGSDEAVTQTFIVMLNEIRARALCKYLIPEPEGQTVDLDLVNVSIVDPTDSGSGETVFHVASEAHCDPITGGWYYDDPLSPSMIVLCDVTCDYINAHSRDVEILVGCKTIVN